MANQIIIDIGAVANDGTGDPLRTAFGYVNNNFSNIWTTGVANSNIAFDGNRILTTNTNGNLVLAPNGIGKVQSNVDIVPNANNTLSLGSLTRQWNTVYAQNLAVGGNVEFNDLTVDGNLTVTGNTIQIGNIVTDTKTIQLANTAGTANAANGSGITVGANDNIATFLYSSVSNAWSTNIGLRVTGNIATTNNISANNINFTNNLFGKTGTFTGDEGGDNSIYAGVPLFTSLGSDVVAQFSGNVDAYTQFNFQNGNAGPQASGDYVITADNGTDSTHFINLGITSSGWDGSQPNSLGNRLGPNDGYLYIQDGDMVIGTSNGNIETWKFDQTGNLTVPGDIIPTGNNTQNLGSATNQWNDLYISNATIFMNSVPISLTAGNVLTVNGANVVTTDGNGNIDVNNITSTANVSIETSAKLVTVSVGLSDWVFNETGNINLPSGGSIIVDGGDGVVGPDGDNMVISWDNEELILRSVGGDVDVEADRDFNIRVNYDVGATDYLTKWVFGQDNEIINITGNSAIITEAGNLNLQGGRNTLSSGNVQITAVNNGVAVNTWQFDNNGDLTLPGGSRLRPLGANLDIFAGTGSYVNLITSDESSYMGVDGSGGYIVTAGGTWNFGTTGNLTAPGNISATGNVLGAYVKGNGSELTNLPAPTVAQDITSNGAMSIMTYDGNLKYVSYATVEPSSGNITGGNILTGGLISATGNITGGNLTVGSGTITGGNVNGANFNGNVAFGTGTVGGSGNITGGNISAIGNITGNTAGFAIGYRDIPQVSFTGNATIATTDAGKHFYSTQSSNFTLTIANNASQGFQVGAAITVVNQGSGTISIAQGSGVTLYLAGNATSGNRSVSTFGMATIMKVATNTWFINGTGVS